ncbi:sialin-like isoform X1 [Schistocerca americana]|uniref:sialin-like isoform X1 n=1 Tax=Schistocerca americana TaxID=7009 RepID=UPI001F4FC45C|nr:sialin-like isoform X1 [Schistocerca americana]
MEAEAEARPLTQRPGKSGGGGGAGAPGCIQIRTCLWYLVFTGTLVNFMITNNVNIAIVDMIKKQPLASQETEMGACSLETQLMWKNDSFENKTENLTSNQQAVTVDSDKVLRFEWDEKQQGMVLGAYFWLHSVLQLPGGMLSHAYGTKKVFGFSNLTMFVLSLLIPVAAKIGYEAIVALRVVQGFIGGLAWPALHSLTANWIPPNERSKFVTAYMGSSVGTALTFPLCGLLISWFGWPSVFYTTGGIGILWFIIWWLVVYDSPAEHPYVSMKEKQLILDSLGTSVSETKAPTPWKAILLSGPMWLNIFSQWGSTWSLFTLMTQAPTYFKFIHGWNIHMTGLLSGIPHVCRIIVALVLSHISDKMLRKGIMSKTGIRKLGSAVCCIIHGFFMLGLAFSGCNYLAAIICIAASVGTSGAVSSGPFASFVDLSPNYASILFGIGCTVADLPGFISPAIVGTLTYQNQSPSQWQIVFLITAGMLFLPGVLYQVFGTSELQSWNTPDNGDHGKHQDKLEDILHPSDISSKEYNESVQMESVRL